MRGMRLRTLLLNSPMDLNLACSASQGPREWETAAFHHMQFGGMNAIVSILGIPISTRGGAIAMVGGANRAPNAHPAGTDTRDPLGLELEQFRDFPRKNREGTSRHPRMVCSRKYRRFDRGKKKKKRSGISVRAQAPFARSRLHVLLSAGHPRRVSGLR